MATAAFQRHQSRGGEGPPSSSSSLTSSLDGRRVFPLVLGLHGMGGAKAPPRLDLSLCLSLFLRSPSAALSPFRIYMEIRNSDWPETFTVIFFPNISFLAAKEEHQPPYGGLTRVGGTPRGEGAPPVSWPPRTPFHLDSSSGKSQIFQNNSPSVFIPFGLRLILGF